MKVPCFSSRFALGVFFSLSYSILIFLLPSFALAQPHVTGQWTALSSDLLPDPPLPGQKLNPIHAGLLRDGRVLILSGSGNNSTQHDDQVYTAGVYDPSKPAGSRLTIFPNLPYDLWCNGMAFLPDGRAFIIGGTDHYDAMFGGTKSSIFDPATNQFVQVQDMLHGRWYATATAMPDGQILTLSGLNENSVVNQLTETYKIAFGWTEKGSFPGSPDDLPLYPWLHLLPDGRVFYSGYTTLSRFYDPVAGTWSSGTISTNFSSFPGRVYGSSVLLPLLPATNYKPRVMILGGAPILSLTDTSHPATKSTEIIDLAQSSPQWVSGPDMSAPRIHQNAVILPTGKVLVVGGSNINEIPDTVGTGGYAADLIDPDTSTVVSAGVASFARLYHSMALLLPDATVLVLGSNPARGVFERNMEIYKPAYLFDVNDNLATRPGITSAPTSPIGYNATFQVQLDTGISSGDSVVLIRPGSPTHAYDMEQRMIGLSFTGTNTLTVTSPPNANVAPPGYYMLFVLKNGVPSVAKFIQLALQPNKQNPEATITSPANDVTVAAGQPVTFNGNSTNPNNSALTFDWIFPEGTPSESNSSSAGPVDVAFATPGTYVVSLTAADFGSDTSDPSPPTVTVNVVPPTVNLTVNRTGNGTGTVSSNPIGISCGLSCTKQYNFGDSVTLTAVADSGSVFTGWSGGCSGTGTCTPSLSADATVTANFDAIPPLVPATSPLPNGEAGVDYSAPLVSGGLQPYTITLVKGAFPPGLSPDPNTGYLKGKPTSKGGSFTVQISYGSGSPSTGSYKVTILKALAIGTKTLKAGTSGKAYTATLKATGGKAPYAWSIASGGLPPGLSMSPSGVISGIPTTPGPYIFSVNVTDPLGGTTLPQSLSLVIN